MVAGEPTEEDFYEEDRCRCIEGRLQIHGPKNQIKNSRIKTWTWRSKTNDQITTGGSYRGSPADSQAVGQ